MTIQEFAEQYRLTARKDACGDDAIPGRLLACAIVEHDAPRLAIALMMDSTGKGGHTLRKRHRAALAAGFVLRQAGDDEAILTFDPTDPEQALAAIRLVRAKTRRVLSPAQLAVAQANALRFAGAHQKQGFLALESTQPAF